MKQYLIILAISCASLTCKAQFVRYFQNVYAKDMIYLKSVNRTFISAANTTTLGNRLLVFNQDLLEIDTSIVMLQGPGKLYPSQDAAYIYVAATGVPMVRRYNVAQRKFDLNIVPNLGFAANVQATNVSIMPDKPNTLAILWSGGAGQYLAIYDEGVRRPDIIRTDLPNPTYNLIFDIKFLRDSSFIYINEQNNSLDGFNLWKHDIAQLGVSATQILAANFSGHGSNLTFDAKRNIVIGRDGRVFSVEPLSGILNFEAAILSGVQSDALDMLTIHPDSSYFHAYALGLLRKYSLNTFSPITFTPPPNNVSLGSMVSYGAHDNLIYFRDSETLAFYNTCTISMNQPIATADKTIFCYGPVPDSTYARAEKGYFKYYWSNSWVTRDSFLQVNSFTDHYISYVAQDSFGCMTPQSNVITFETSPSASPPSIITNKDTICIGDVARMEAMSWVALPVFWTNGAQGPINHVTQSGQYAAWLETSPGCKTPLSNIITITKKDNNPPPAPIVTTVEAPPYCRWDTLHLVSSASEGNIWSGSILSQHADTVTTFIYQALSHFTVFVRDTNGCISDTTAHFINATELNYLPINYFYPYLQSLPKPGVIYHWYLDNIKVATTNVERYMPTTPGWYSIQTEELGCMSGPSGSQILVLNIDTEEQNAGIFSIYPNPVSEILHIDCDFIINQIRCFDAQGRLVFHITPAQQLNINLDVQYLPQGTYHLLLQSDNRVHNVQFIR